MKLELLRLFKGYYGKKRKNAKMSQRALEYGILIPESAGEEVINEAIRLYGKDAKKWNLTFHKSFDIVAKSDLQTLVVQQIIHYITTYGFEELGIYNEDTVYIPKEKLELAALEDGVELIVINAMNDTDIKERLMTLLTSGIALSSETVEDVEALLDYINPNEIEQVKNREVRLLLYSKYDLTPQNPDEFFKYLILRTTGIGMKIKNTNTIKAIEESGKKLAVSLLNTYITKVPNGMEKLASIFLRNKDLFLAFKVKDYDESVPEINTIINKIRKLADTNHKPLKKANIDSLTDANIEIDVNKLLQELDNVTVYREIRALNSVLYRLTGCTNMLYKVRNGSAFVKEVEANSDEYVKRLESLRDVIQKHLVNRISKNVKGKTIYIPENINYAVPTSEKKFLGAIPEGSYITIPRQSDLIYGIHWKNLNGAKDGGNRVDLDLKQMSQDAMFGWDADYRDNFREVLFSGDITDAPLGATELFYVKRVHRGAYLLTVNSYTQNGCDVPFEFMIAKPEAGKSIERNYVVNPNDIITKVDLSVLVGQWEKTLGMIVLDDDVKFYFNEFSTGANRTSRVNKTTMGALSYLKNYNKAQLKLHDLLKEAGAILVDSPTVITSNDITSENGELITEIKETPVDYNLSLESLAKDSIINIFKEV